MGHKVQAGLVLVLGLVVLFCCAQQAPPEIKWASSLEDAFQMATEQNLPVIAEFWSDG